MTKTTGDRKELKRRSTTSEKLFAIISGRFLGVSPSFGVSYRLISFFNKECVLEIRDGYGRNCQLARASKSNSKLEKLTMHTEFMWEMRRRSTITQRVIGQILRDSAELHVSQRAKGSSSDAIPGSAAIAG